MYRPLMSILVFFGLGIILQEYIAISFKLLIIINITLLILGMTLIRRRKLAGIIIFLSFLVLGSAYLKNYQVISVNDVNNIARFYRKKPVFLEGIVISDVDKKDYFNGTKTSFFLKVKRFQTDWGWRNKTGKLLVNIFDNQLINYGDYLLLEGNLHYPFNFESQGKFSYKKYLQRRGIKRILSVKKNNTIETLESHQGNFIKGWSIKIRNRFKKIFSYYLTKNESGIMKAIILGDRSNIPAHIRELFVRTGTAHILAISGLHIGIVTALIFLFLSLCPLSRKMRYTMTIILLIGYAFLTGGRASVIRATIMAIVLLSSFLVERETDPINSLSLAGLVILLINPLNIFDVGFQLSFMSVLSIICFYPKWMRIFQKIPLNHKSKAVSFLTQSLAVSLSAWLGVIGLIAYYFQIITPVTIIANLIIIPLITLIVALGMGLLFIAILIPACAFAIAICIKMSLSVMVVIVYLFDQIPGSHFYIQNVTYWYVLAYYSLIWCLIFAGRIHKSLNLDDLSAFPVKLTK